MNILLLIATVLGLAGQNVLKKPYTDRVGSEGTYFFGTVVALSALLFFLLTAGELNWSKTVLPYSLAFAVSYIFATVGAVKAVAIGPLSLGSLVISYSLMLPALFGIVALKESVNALWLCGVVLLMLSLFFINGHGDDRKIGGKWVFWVAVAFFGNGACSIVQKLQQNACDSNYKNEFMIVALAMVAVTSAVLSVIFERKSLKRCAKLGSLSGAACGILNGGVNLSVMVLGGRMSQAVIFPLISAGSNVLTVLASVTVFRERLSARQTVAVLLGTLSVVLINV